MKTKAEIQIEAQQLTTLARQHHREPSLPFSRSEIVPLAHVLLTLPSAPFAPRPPRQIDAVEENGDLLFRLVEPPKERPEPDERETSNHVLLTSDSAYDVLRAGYELAEEERLAQQLAPYAEASEAGPIRSETVAEVEVIVETQRLPPAARMRAKADIIEFLSGRMDGSSFIANAVERQCEREGVSEHRTERHELTLTMDEP